MLVATDSFGGWRDAPAVSAAIADRLRAAGHAAWACPLSDGGEGLGAVLAHHGRLAGHRLLPTPDGPVRVPQLAPSGDVLVESAAVIGLPPPGARRPWEAGSGPLGACRVAAGGGLLGLGGTGCIDLGLGLLAAFGVGLADARGRPLGTDGPVGARSLGALASLSGAPPRLAGWTVLADVSTPLDRAVARFGPQKGFAPDALGPLAAALDQARHRIDAWLGAHGRPALDPRAHGAGAAGGLGALLRALGATVRPGAAWAVDTLLRPAIATHGPTVLVTGEGRLDGSTADDKLVARVAAAARDAALPCWALVGTQAPGGCALPGLTGVVAADAIGGPDRARALLRAADVLAARLAEGVG